MLYPTLESLVDIIGNRYLLVNVTAKRAREIAEEAEINEVRLNEKPVKLALDDIVAGKIVNTTEIEIPQGAGASIEE